VAVLHDADQRSVRGIGRELVRLGNAARDGKLTMPELTGSTFTITSLGKDGGMFATPVINHPEVAILGIHRIEPRPVVVDRQIVIRDRMYMSCSFDHRVIDGHVGAAFVAEVKRYLETPELLLLELA
jgi:pyruvate dehydrogenase E2 component (dihydrolipoamide acetyltransferase)